jgi:hypothetical protein
MAGSNGPRIVTNGLVVAIDAADRKSYLGSGTVWRDLSGRNNNWTINGSPTFSQNNGGYFDLDNTNDEMTLGSNSSIPSGANARSLMIWFYTVAASWGVDVNNLFFTGSAGTRLSFGIDMDNYPNMQVYTSGDDITLATPFAQTGWANICVTYNGSTTILVYCNGILSGTKTLGGTLNTTANTLYFGSQGGATWFNGRLSNLLMYNRALSASEVLLNFNAARSRFSI